MTKIRIALVGCGYWGPNLIRNIMASPALDLVAVCEANPTRLENLRLTYGHLRLVGTLDELLGLSLDAVAIATPVASHYSIASRCLEQGLHVLVEKPLAATSRQAETLIALAARQKRTLMVDHTYLFHNGVRLAKQLVDSGDLGDLYYVDSVRINLGQFQSDVNVVWDLAPHDFSIVDYVLGQEARSISAWGCAHVDSDIEDIAYVNVDYHEHLLANFHVNWLSPVKIRQMIFAGSRKSLIFNDLNTTEPIKVYDRGIELGKSEEERHKALVGYRSGDVWSPYVEPGEALRTMVEHFAECVREEKAPLCDGAAGLRVVRILETATRSLRAQGGRVVLPAKGGANGDGNQRSARVADQLPHRPRRSDGQERDGALLREPVWLLDR